MKSLEEIIHDIGHHLPSQGPLEVFVHHNTLHAFEDRPFLQGVEEAAKLYGSHPYLAESAYRQAYLSGRITDTDLRFVIAATHNLDSEHDFREIDAIRALLVAAPDVAARESVLWELLEGGCLERPLVGIGGPRWEGTLARERAWLQGLNAAERTSVQMKLVCRHPFWNDEDELVVKALADLLKSDTMRVARISLRMVWLVALRLSWEWREVDRPMPATLSSEEKLRVAVHEQLTPFLTKLAASFLDQGMGHWQLPKREQGFLVAALSLLTTSVVGRSWVLQGIEHLAATLDGNQPYKLIAKVLSNRGVPSSQWASVLLQESLALKGWAGFMRLIETRSDITTLAPRARQHALANFLALKMFVEDYAVAALQRSHGHEHDLRSEDEAPDIHRIYARAFHIFRWCQVTGTTATKLANLSNDQGARLRSLFLNLSELARRRMWHLAYERHLERRTFKAFLTRAGNPLPLRSATRFQVVTCIDDREESFRRHLEALGGHISTFGTAGFFGVDVEYEDLRHEAASYCPVAITPRHRVTEVPRIGARDIVRRREALAYSFSSSREVVNMTSRGAIGGWMVSLGGFLAFIPMVLRTLFPRLARFVKAKTLHPDDAEVTEIVYQRAEQSDDFSSEKYLGFTITEMTDRVEGLLQSIGLISHFAPLVVLLGHGSSSRNNPFRSAYDCGACGGRPGRINGRVFALMANREDVRGELSRRGIEIPPTTHFLGGYHDTCSDEVFYFDSARLPTAMMQLFRELQAAIYTARRHNAAERCRRFGVFPRHRRLRSALAHVEGRAGHIAEPRPEYGHATNALCIIGRRSLTRGLFLDRRAFLVSYDPAVDGKGDIKGTILSSVLAAVLPVCMGISLEYFFSAVDNEVYGAGTKLPLNITALIGAITGFASDLRTGLPAQMIEIHEPVRLITIVDCPTEYLEYSLEKVPYLKQLIENDWIRLCRYDAENNSLVSINGLDPGSRITLADLAPEELLDEVATMPESMDHLPFIAIHHSR